MLKLTVRIQTGNMLTGMLSMPKSQTKTVFSLNENEWEEFLCVAFSEK